MGQLFVCLVEDAHIVARGWLGDRAGKSRENLAVFLSIQEVASDGPASLRLPPGVVDLDVGELAVNPINCIWVASLAYEREAVEGACIILLHPLTFVVDLLDNSHTSGCHVQTVDLVLLDAVPNNTCVGYNWLTFEEDAGSSSK